MEQDKSMLDNAAKSILVNKEEIWTKQSTSEKIYELFDITMVSKHGAEISKLVGLYILQGLKQTLPDKFKISPKVTRVFVRFVNLEVKIIIFTSK